MNVAILVLYNYLGNKEQIKNKLKAYEKIIVKHMRNIITGKHM